jgi:hypothetical protein
MYPIQAKIGPEGPINLKLLGYSENRHVKVAK